MACGAAKSYSCVACASAAQKEVLRRGVAGVRCAEGSFMHTHQAVLS